MGKKLYTEDDGVISCNACGAYTLSGDEEWIQHYSICKGKAEIEKWDKYYSDPEWKKATTTEEGGK